MRALAAVVLAEIGLGLLPLILPALVILLLIAYVLIRPLWWIALIWFVYKLGSKVVGWRMRVERARLDALDPPLIDKSKGVG